MKTNKKSIELKICTEFIKGTSYTLMAHSDAPDCILRDGKGKEIGLEITTALWPWQGASSVQDVLAKKCQNNYGTCILVIYIVDPVFLHLWLHVMGPLGRQQPVNQLRKTLKTEHHLFSEIYVCFFEPFSNEFNPNAGNLTFYRICPPTDKLHNLDRETFSQQKKQFEEFEAALNKMSLEEMEEEFKDLNWPFLVSVPDFVARHKNVFNH